MIKCTSDSKMNLSSLKTKRVKMKLTKDSLNKLNISDISSQSSVSNPRTETSKVYNLSTKRQMTKKSSSNLLTFSDKEKRNISSSSPNPMANIVSIKVKSDEKSTMKINFALAEKGYPEILSNLNYQTKTLTLSETWIDLKNLKDYFQYVKLCFNHKDEKEFLNLRYNFKKLTKLANYFENEKVLSFMIKMNIQPNINCDTCISLINDAFNYCSDSLIKSNLKSKWFGLFLLLRTFIIENFLYFLDEKKVKSFLKINCKLMEEIIESFLLDIYQKGIEIQAEQAIIIVNYIIFIRTFKEAKNFSKVDTNELFSLLSKEEKHFETEEFSKEMMNINPPTLTINLLKDIQYNYQEKAVQFHKQEIIFILKYDSNTDTFTVFLRLNPVNKIDVFCFYSFGFILQEKDITQTHFGTINTNSKVPIFTINSFRGYLNFMKGIREFDEVSININLKFCVMQSFLICYLKSAFEEIYLSNEIKFLPSDMLNILLYGSGFKDEYVLTALMTWLSNGNNDSDEIIETLDVIEWKNVSLGRIFEFIIRFPYCISHCPQIENFVITSIFAKASDKLNEFNREKIYSRKETNNTERKQTQFSYEGEIEKVEGILSYNNEMNNVQQKKTEEEEKNSTNPMNIQDQNQLHLISYFFVNLLECSKKLNYQQMANNFEKQNKKQQKSESCSQLSNRSQSIVNNYFNMSNESATLNNKIEPCENDTSKMACIVVNNETIKEK